MNKLWDKFLLLGIWLAPAMAFAQAVPSPTPTTTTPNLDQITQVLENAIQIAAGLPGVVGAIFVAVIGLAIAILVIANYFLARGQREAAAYQTQLQVQQTQEADLAQMQSDAAQALINNMDVVYVQDYNYFLSMIQAGNYPAVYSKLSIQFQPQIASFIYDTTIPAEQRAAHIILLMKAAATPTTSVEVGEKKK